MQGTPCDVIPNYCCQTIYYDNFGACATINPPKEQNCLDCSLPENNDVCSDCNQAANSSNGCEARAGLNDCISCPQIPTALAPPTSPANSTPTTRRSSEESYRRRKVLMPDGSCVWIITGMGLFIEYPDC